MATLEALEAKLDMVLENQSARFDRVEENQRRHAERTGELFDRVEGDCREQAIALGELRADVKNVKERLDSMESKTVIGGSAAGGAFGMLTSFLWRMLVGGDDPPSMP